MLSRRGFLINAGSAGASLALGLLPPLAGRVRPGQRRTGDTPVDQARRAALTDPITVQQVGTGMHCVFGLGGNILVIDDGSAVTLVDGGLAGERLATTVTGLTKSSIRRLINTHWHFDHTDANTWFGLSGATIVAHRQTRRHLSQPTRVDDFGYTFAALPPAGRPTEVLQQEHSHAFGNARVTLTPYGWAHTDSDLAVRVNDDELLHTGDTWWNGSYPFIDYSTGGSLDGMIRATERNLAFVTDRTRIIPGHGPAGSRADLRLFHDLLSSARDRISRLKQQRFSLAEIIRKAPNTTYDATWGTALVDPAFFTRLVYKGVS